MHYKDKTGKIDGTNNKVTVKEVPWFVVWILCYFFFCSESTEGGG